MARRLLVPGLVAVVAIAFGAAFGLGVATQFAPAEHDLTVQPGPPPVTAPPLQAYTSTGDGFRVRFPGPPHIERKSFSDGFDQIPYTVYTARSDGTPGFRAVNVYDYTIAPIAEGDTTPERALNDLVQNLPGAQLLSSGDATLDGRDAVVGNYTVLTSSQPSQTLNCFVEIIEVGPRLYMVSGGGISRADFDTFAGSFHLTQS